MAEPNRGVILIVDADPDARDLCSFALTGAGFRCVAVASVPEALQRAAVVRFDLVLMAVAPARGDEGLAFARRLRAQALPSPIVAVRAHDVPAAFERGLFAASVRTPVDPEDLVSVVLRVLAAADPS